MVHFLNLLCLLSPKISISSDSNHAEEIIKDTLHKLYTDTQLSIDATNDVIEGSYTELNVKESDKKDCGGIRL